jgi:hypothetical protein
VNRRGFGRGRLIVGVAATIALVGCVLPWYRVGGDGGLPAVSANAFDGAGILVFLAAVAALALIALPYAAGDQPLAVDRPASFVLVASIGVAALALRIVQLAGIGALSLPDRSPGLWIAGLAILLVAWGAAEIVSEREPR